VLGAGAVGTPVVEALVRRGESVRVVNRSGLREPIAGVHSATGDITDPAFAASATRRARHLRHLHLRGRSLIRRPP
jgi:nucleoside-diphosphate-sugar epimerase